LLEREIWATVENARVVECRAVIELVERHNIVMLGIRERQVPDEPASAVRLSVASIFHAHTVSHMKPAPPVTRMFRASARGSKRVVPVSTGACFQRSSVR
jgi:hypothetical protein